MSYVTLDEYRGRCKTEDERFTRDKERLEKIEDTMRTVSDCTVRLTELIEQNNKELMEHEGRLKDLERRPSVWFDRAVSAALGAVVVAIVSYMMRGF